MMVDELWEYLEGNGIATDDELILATSGWGYSLETLETVLFVRTGYRSLEQIMGDDEDEDDE